MFQRHLWVDGMTTGHTENLQICVLAITFIHLQQEREQFITVSPMLFFCSIQQTEMWEIAVSKLVLTLTRARGKKRF